MRILGITAVQAILRLDNATAYDSRLRKTPGGTPFISRLTRVAGIARNAATEKGRRLFMPRDRALVGLEVVAHDIEAGVQIDWESRLTRWGVFAAVAPLLIVVCLAGDVIQRSLESGTIDVKAGTDLGVGVMLGAGMWAILRAMGNQQRDYLVDFLQSLFAERETANIRDQHNPQ